MKHFIFILLGLLSFVYADVLKIDRVYLLENISIHPKDIDSRIILAKSYFQENDYNNALTYIQEAINLDTQNHLALKLKAEILELQHLDLFFKKNGIKNFKETKKIKIFLYSLYEDGKYQEYIDSYQVLDKYSIKVSENIYIFLANSYIKLGQYKLAKQVVDKLYIDEKSEDFLLLKAELSSVLNEDLNTKKYYQLLLKDFDKLKYNIALFDFYEKKQNLPQALKIYEKIKRTFPKNVKEIKEVKKRVANLQKKSLQVLKLAYKKDPSFEILKPYVYTLYDLNKEQEAIKHIEDFIKSNEKHNKAKILLSDLYYWHGDLQKSITTLSTLAKNSKDINLLKPYTVRLYENGQYKDALQYLPKLVESTINHDEKKVLQTKLAYAYYYTGEEKKAQQLFTSLLQSVASKDMQKALDQIKLRSILALAVEQHKQKKYQLALTNYKNYFTMINDPQIAKELGEIYYFKMKSYQKSLDYYNYYLKTFPEDEVILFHYATAYEKLEQYKKSAEIFKKISAQKNDLYYLSKYHYGSSLKSMKEDTAWLKSRKVLKSLLQELHMTKQTPENIDLIKYTKIALKEVEKPMLKPMVYGDIILAEGQTKIISPEEVFSMVNIMPIHSPSLQSMFNSKKQNKRPNISFLFDYVNDDKLYNRTYGIKIDDIISIKDTYFGFSTKKSYFNSHRRKKEADEYYIHGYNDDIYITLGFVEFKDDNNIFSSIGYSKNLRNHQLDFSLMYTNGVFVNNRSCMIREKTEVLQLNIYDKIILKNLDESDFNLQINAYDNDNINIAVSVNHSLFHQEFNAYEHTIDFSGFYDYNTKRKICYHPLEFYDVSYLRIKPKFSLSSYGYVEGILGIGYSFENKEVVSTYGLNASISLNKYIDFEVYCNHSQSSYSQNGYNTCSTNIMYTW